MFLGSRYYYWMLAVGDLRPPMGWMQDFQNGTFPLLKYICYLRSRSSLMLRAHDDAAAILMSRRIQGHTEDDD